jgi:transcriptional regulator with XRE-family HTH domain
LYRKYAELRERAGVTDYEVAKRTGVSTVTLTNWKYGRYNPKFDKLLAIARYFGVPVEYFADDQEAEKEEA